ncbi:MAG: hypothetical protein ACTHKM_00320 [Tsuneonella sp.]
MAKAVALARSLESQWLEVLRVAIVSGSALALIAAGRALPF